MPERSLILFTVPFTVMRFHYAVPLLIVVVIVLFDDLPVFKMEYIHEPHGVRHASVKGLQQPFRNQCITTRNLLIDTPGIMVIDIVLRKVSEDTLLRSSYPIIGRVVYNN